LHGTRLVGRSVPPRTRAERSVECSSARVSVGLEDAVEGSSTCILGFDVQVAVDVRARGAVVADQDLELLEVHVGIDQLPGVPVAQVVEGVPLGSPTSSTTFRQQWPNDDRRTGWPSRLVISRPSGPGGCFAMCWANASSTTSSTGTVRVDAGDLVSHNLGRMPFPKCKPARRTTVPTRLRPAGCWGPAAGQRTHPVARDGSDAAARTSADSTRPQHVQARLRRTRSSRTRSHESHPHPPKRGRCNRA
jgi:hypothetical protein